MLFHTETTGNYNYNQDVLFAENSQAHWEQCVCWSNDQLEMIRAKQMLCDNAAKSLEWKIALKRYELVFMQTVCKQQLELFRKEPFLSLNY